MSDGIAQRWREFLEAVPFARPADAQQARVAFRRGRVADLDVTTGVLEATVREASGPSLHVRILWPPVDAVTWEKVARELSSELRFVADLTDNRVSDEVVAALERAGVDVVAQPDALTVECSCAREAMWCAHGAAVLVAFATRLDRSPELVLRLRGRSVDVLARDAGATAEHQVGVSGVEVHDHRSVTAPRGDLDAVVVRPSYRADAGTRLTDIAGPPPAIDAASLAKVVADAARFAWRLASGEGTDVADDELLLAALRAQGTSSVESLASALASEPDEVRRRLEALHARGEVLRAGAPGDTAVRYRAAGRPIG